MKASRFCVQAGYVVLSRCKNILICIFIPAQNESEDYPQQGGVLVPEREKGKTMGKKTSGNFVPKGGHPFSGQYQNSTADENPSEECRDCDTPRKMSDIARLQARGVLRIGLGGGGHVE